MRIHLVAVALAGVGVWTALACSRGDGESTRLEAAAGSGAAAGAENQERVNGGVASARMQRNSGGEPTGGSGPAGGAESSAGSAVVGSGGRTSLPETSSEASGGTVTGGTSTGGATPINTASGGVTTGGSESSGTATGGVDVDSSGGSGGLVTGAGGSPSAMPSAGAAGADAEGGTGAALPGGAGGDAGVPPDPELALVVTEIMFNPQSSPELEWVELCNRAPDPLDLGGYTYWDDDNDASVAPNFPANAVVPGAACVVLTGADDVTAFQNAWGETIPVIGLDAFPILTNSGDRVQIWDAEHPPSPEDVDPAADTVLAFEYPGSLGDGAASIQLVDITADPADPASWELSTSDQAATVTADGDVGTPGIAP